MKNVVDFTTAVMLTLTKSMTSVVYLYSLSSKEEMIEMLLCKDGGKKDYTLLINVTLYIVNLCFYLT